jgi:hypothetical protein
MTIKSQPFDFAVSRIAVAGCTCETCKSSGVIPACSAMARVSSNTLAAFSLLAASYLSISCCEGAHTAVPTPIAPGSGSETVMTVTLAFKAFAKAIPCLTPFLATSDPSVLNRILAYISRLPFLHFTLTTGTSASPARLITSAVAAATRECDHDVGLALFACLLIADRPCIAIGHPVGRKHLIRNASLDRPIVLPPIGAPRPARDHQIERISRVLFVQHFKQLVAVISRKMCRRPTRPNVSDGSNATGHAGPTHPSTSASLH